MCIWKLTLKLWYIFPKSSTGGVWISNGVAQWAGICKGLRASSLQFTFPLEFNAIFGDGFPLRLDLNGWSKIRDPVTAKFKHLTVIVTLRYYVVMTSRTCRRCEISKKADLKPYPYGKKYTTFSFPIHGALASNICLRDAPTCSCIQLYT